MTVDSPTSLRMYPTNFADIATHSITILISDFQPLGTSYTFSIEILNNPPVFLVPLEPKIQSIASTLPYTIQVQDPEGGPVSIAFTSTTLDINSFTTLTGATFTFNPTLYT